MTRWSRLAATALVLAACSLPPPRRTEERPVGSETWVEVETLPAWVLEPPQETGVVRVVVDAKSAFRHLAGTFEGTRDVTVRHVETALVPVVGTEGASRVAAVAPGALRLVGRACEERVLTRDTEQIPSTSATVWWLWELPLDPLLAPLPAQDRPAARDALASLRRVP